MKLFLLIFRPRMGLRQWFKYNYVELSWCQCHGYRACTLCSSHFEKLHQITAQSFKFRGNYRIYLALFHKTIHMNTVNWTGVYPALLTPFKNDDTIDFELFEKN